MSLLSNIRYGLIDPDTPKSAMSKTSIDGRQLNLVVRTIIKALIGSQAYVSSSPMSSINLVGRSTLEMMPISQLSICGME